MKGVARRGYGRSPPALPSCMDRSSPPVAAAFSRMEGRRVVRSRAAGRLLVRAERLHASGPRGCIGLDATARRPMVARGRRKVYVTSGSGCECRCRVRTFCGMRGGLCAMHPSPLPVLRRESRSIRCPVAGTFVGWWRRSHRRALVDCLLSSLRSDQRRDRRRQFAARVAGCRCDRGSNRAAWVVELA